MSWEYDPKDWNDPEVEAHRNSLRHIVGDPGKALKEHTLFGFNCDVWEPETLRLLLAYMLIYKDMR